MPIPQLKQRVSRVYGEVRAGARRGLRSATGWGFKRWFFLLGGLAAVGAVSLIGLLWWVSLDLPDPNKLNERQVAESTKIYDRTGKHLLYEVYQDKKRTIVSLENISPYVPQAFVAVEDKHFYEHNGVRPLSILRAQVNNMIGRRAGSGGASTITQQLVKNVIVGAERSGLRGYLRKIKEAILAMQLEKKYSKEQILQLYLNEIPLGSTNYGVEAAAQSYFHKTAKELTLAEAATLAALNQAPSRYLNDLAGLRGRRDLVLRFMHEQGYVTEAQKTEAQKTELTIFPNKGIKAATHFVLRVKKLLAAQFGENLVDTGGLKVITTLDYDKQLIAEQAVKEQGDKLFKTANANNAALVALEPQTAQILALVGSRDYNNNDINGKWDIVSFGNLQPGSSFKPFVYTAAFEKGYTPDTVLYDVKTEFDATGRRPYHPRNSYDKENGLVTMRKALQGSLNIPAVKTLYLVGIPETIEFAKRFGYSTFTGEYGLSMVLGAAEVNVLEHANGFATLANGGRYREPVSILKVTNIAGEILLEWRPEEGIEAVSPELAALTTSVLSDDEARSYVFGRNGNLTLPGRQAAAKTGTTQEAKDAWTLGYVPSLAAGVWVGNTPKPLPMKADGNRLAGSIWHQFMVKALASTTPEKFPEPPPNDALKPVLRGADAGIKLRINVKTGRIAAATTPDNLVTEKTYLPPHDILHYVEKDTPRGQNPVYPADDPQYLLWERALEEWAAKQQKAGKAIAFEEPPTEYDTVQSAELAPTVEIFTPRSGDTVTARTISLSVNASAPRGVAQVIYYIDGGVVAQSNQYPFGASYYAQMLSQGSHTLKVVAMDDLGNSSLQEILFTMAAPLDPPSFSWSDAAPLVLSKEDFPRAVFLNPFRWDATQEIKIYLYSAGGEQKLIYTFNHADSALTLQKLQFIWLHYPGAGNYTLRGVLNGTDGSVLERSLEVQVK